MAATYQYHHQHQHQHQHLQIPIQNHAQQASYACLYPECAGQHFKRFYDYQRHLQHVHNPEQCQRFECQMPGCNRVGAHPFTRKDKYYDHLREVHGVDIPKRQQGRRSP